MLTPVENVDDCTVVHLSGVVDCQTGHGTSSSSSSSYTSTVKKEAAFISTHLT